MTKGTGQEVLALMVAENILSLSGKMYFLDPDLLAAKTGVTYAECMACRFGGEAIAFVNRALTAGD